MASSHYRVGTVSVTNGSKIVMGSGTKWTLGVNKPLAGDIFYIGFQAYEVEQIVSDTQLRLFSVFQGTTATGQKYAIWRNASLNISSRIAASVSMAINQKQKMLTELNVWMTDTTGPTVPLTDVFGVANQYVPLPLLIKNVNDMIQDTSHITQIVNEGKQARDEAVNANQAVQQAKSSVDSSKSSIDSTKQAIDTIKSQIDTEAQTIHTQHGEVNTWHSEVQSAASHVDTQKRAVDTAKSAIDTAKSDIDTKHGQINTWHTEAQQAASAATSAKNSVDATKGQIDTIKSGIDTKAATVATQHGEVDTWHTEVAANTNKAEAAKTAAETAAATAKSNVPHEFQYNKVRNALREIYDASGVVDWGKHGSDPINQGMYTDLTTPNSLMWGGGSNGDSKTAYPVLNIAGHEIHVRGVNNSDADNNVLSFKGAEDGTTVTDSTGNCRGSGKAVLNLKTDIDPKYGNAPTGTAAEIQREAVGRAFEADIRNGDFRNGTSNWASSNGASITVSNGLLTLTQDSYGNGQVTNTGVSPVDGESYIAEVVITSSSAVTLKALLGNKDVPLVVGVNTIPFTFSTGQYVLPVRHIGGNSGETTTVASISIRKASEDVLTRAVDLKYLEVWDEEDELEFFPYGSSQSGLTTVDGFTTEASSRPDTYRAVFPGDTASSKQCLKIAKLSFVDIAKLMSNPKHNWFYNEAGKPTQVRYRDKAVRGAGNGDFESISVRDSGWARFNMSNYLTAQGMRDAPVGYVSSGFPRLAAIGSGQMEIAEKGVYQAVEAGGVGDTAAGYKGECFVIPICTVPRLNMGAYSHANSFGSRSWHAYGVATNFKWTDSRLGSAVSIQSASFIASSATDSIGYKGDSGSISYGNSGHPDGLLHDAIYASGFNGVIDHRQPAKSPEDSWKESLQGYYSAKVRGVQKLPFTKVERGGTSGRNNGIGLYSIGSIPDQFAIASDVGLLEGVRVGDRCSVYDTSNGDVMVGTCSSVTGGSLSYLLDHSTDKVSSGSSNGDVSNLYFIVEQSGHLNTSVSGAFSCITVIADPANLVQTPQIAQGVIGVWSPVIGDGTNKSFPYVRKLLSQSSGVGTDNNGTSWWSASFGGFDSATNEQVMSSAATSVRLMSYKAYAYQVEDGENFEPVSEGDIGDVFQHCRHEVNRGNAFMEGALHKVAKSANIPYTGKLALLSHQIDIWDKNQLSNTNKPEHAPLTLAAPANSSPAMKALPFLVEKNGYLYIAWHVNELFSDPDRWHYGKAKTVASATEDSVIYTLYYLPSSIATGSLPAGFYMCVANFSSVNWNDVRWVSVGNDEWRVDSASTDTQLISWRGNGWGDDSKIKVTSKGWDTFVDLNGNKMTRRVVISTFPIGPAKKKTLVGGLSSPA